MISFHRYLNNAATPQTYLLYVCIYYPGINTRSARGFIPAGILRLVCSRTVSRAVCICSYRVYIFWSCITSSIDIACLRNVISCRRWLKCYRYVKSASLTCATKSRWETVWNLELRFLHLIKLKLLPPSPPQCNFAQTRSHIKTVPTAV